MEFQILIQLKHLLELIVISQNNIFLLMKKGFTIMLLNLFNRYKEMGENIAISIYEFLKIINIYE